MSEKKHSSRHRARARRRRWPWYTAAGLLLVLALGTAGTVFVLRRDGSQVDPAQAHALTRRLQATDGIDPELAACVARDALGAFDSSRLSVGDLEAGTVPGDLKDAFVAEVSKAFSRCSR